MPSSSITIETVQDAAAEIGRSVRDQLAHLQQIEADLSDIETAEALGVEGAAARAGDLRAAKIKAETDLSDLRARQSSTDARLREMLELRAANENVRRQQTIAKLAPRYAELSNKAQSTAQELGAVLTELQDTGDQLATAIGTAEASRLLGFQALKDRVQHSFYMPLTYALTQSNHSLSAGSDLRTSWLGYTVNNRAACKETLTERTQKVLDHIETIFATEAAAWHRAARVDATGQTAFILPVIGTGLFQLVRGTLRGAAAKLRKENQP